MEKLTITTSIGAITLVLRPDAAPLTVAYIKKCADAGLYDGTSFYRRSVIELVSSVHVSGCVTVCMW
jgi:cyclophilin family peptidyl-prolyl cis-trans isomerase